MADSSTVELYYDPFDYRDRRRSVSGVETDARRSAAVFQRQVQLLRAESLRRRRTCTPGLADLSVGTRHHRRHPVQWHRGAAGHPAVRGSATARSAPASACHGSSLRGGCWRSRTWYANSVSAHWIRCAMATGSTSSPISAPSCRCGRSAICSAFPRKGNSRSATATTRASQSQRSKAISSQTVIQESIAMFADYIEWRATHPSDDLMTELLNAEIEEPDGTRRRLERTEVLAYTAMIAGAGNETTARLIGFMGQLLGEHPDQRRELVADPSLIPSAVEETLRYEPPSPVQARYVAADVELYGHTVTEGSYMLLLNGSANRDESKFRRSRPLRHPPDGRSSELRPGAALLPRLGAGAAGGAGRVRRGPQAMDRLGCRLRQREQGADVERARLGAIARQDPLAREGAGEHWSRRRRSRRRTPAKRATGPPLQCSRATELDPRNRLRRNHIRAPIKGAHRRAFGARPGRRDGGLLTFRHVAVRIQRTRLWY